MTSQVAVQREPDEADDLPEHLRAIIDHVPEHIAQVVGAAPPLTAELAARLRAMLRPLQHTH